MLLRKEAKSMRERDDEGNARTLWRDLRPMYMLFLSGIFEADPYQSIHVSIV